jgi:iron complex outermembrane receptor protein
VVSPLPAVCTPPFVTFPGACLPAGFQLPNPGTIYRTYERSDKFNTPRFTLEYKPAAGQLVYLSYAVGEKPGGITTLFGGSGLTSDRGLFEFEAEKLKEYELGAKFTIDDFIGVNLAFFKEDFTDKQVQTQVPIGNLILTRTTNASSATVDGIEISVNARFTPRFTLNAAYQFLDGRYDDYVIASGGASEIARVGNCTPTVLVAGAAPTCLVDRSGRKLEEAPEHTLTLNARYRAPLGSTGLNWFIEGDVRHETERFIDDANTFKVDDHTLGNLRFGLEGEKWGAILFVDNVTDDDSPLSGGTGPGTVTAVFRTATLVAPGQPVAFRGVFAPRFPTSYFANMPDPRQIGLRVRYKF